MKQLLIILVVIAAAAGGWYFFNKHMQDPTFVKHQVAAPLEGQRQLVTIYGNSSCIFCEQAKALLDRIGAKYVEKDVSDSRVLEEMYEKTGHAQGIPQILIGDKHIGGFADLRRLHEEGNLRSMLTEAR